MALCSARGYTLGDLEPFTDYQLTLKPRSHGPDPEASVKFTTKAGCKVLIHGGIKRKDSVEVWGDASLTAACSRRYDHSASVLPGRGVLVAGGGVARIWSQWSVVGGRSSCELVDPVSLTSEPLTALPEPRAQHASITLGSDVLIAGGLLDDGSMTSSTLIYRNKVWEPCAHMVRARDNFGMATNGTAAYVFGGGNSCICERYDAVSNRWTQLPKLPSPCTLSRAVYLAGRFYVIGGFGTQQVWILDPKSERWETGPELNRGRVCHCALAIDNRIWVFGGMGMRDKDSKTVEYYDPNRNAWTLCQTELQLPCWGSAAVALP